MNYKILHLPDARSLADLTANHSMSKDEIIEQVGIIDPCTSDEDVLINGERFYYDNLAIISGSASYCAHIWVLAKLAWIYAENFVNPSELTFRIQLRETETSSFEIRKIIDLLADAWNIDVEFGLSSICIEGEYTFCYACYRE